MGARVCKALRLISVLQLSGDRGGRGARLPTTWASEAKERMAEVAATEPQGSLRGVMASRKLTRRSRPWRGCAVGGTSVAGPRGPTGGRGEQMKVPVGPQTVTVVGPCPLPLPSLAPHPISGGPGEGSRNLKGSECAVRVAISVSSPPCSPVSLLVDCAALGPGLSEFLRLFPSASTVPVLPWALCVRVDGAECSGGGFNELLWVAPHLGFPAPPPGVSPWGVGVFVPICAFPFVHPAASPLHPPSAPGCARQAPCRSKLAEACVPARGLDACLPARKGIGAW